MPYMNRDSVIPPDSYEIVLLRLRWFPTELFLKTLQMTLGYLKMCLC
ncbi:Phosphoenolpyruvate carboxylase [Gossypium arboreum]|uniref:Phosphoenolpyruvate carboxylase n=1 Tax=Gossypium arboreum TaxID=29729 RepID=A0A0B0P9N7_GOSAR|nr:Phosphoenolpyruvate carboxylase [Gossypium arboreum]